MKKHNGFTIVELLIAIVVIATLASITVVAFNSVQERAYSARVIATVDSYSKALKLYHIQNGRFPDYGNTWGTCLGRTADYPAADGFPAGACSMFSDGSSIDYANDNLYNELKTIMPNMPDPRTKVAEESGFSGGRKLRKRGIYYEHQNNSPGSTYPDWAYVEYIVRGNVPCPQKYVTRYEPADNVTFCSNIIHAQDAGID